MSDKEENKKSDDEVEWWAKKVGGDAKKKARAKRKYLRERRQKELDKIRISKGQKPRSEWNTKPKKGRRPSVTEYDEDGKRKPYWKLDENGEKYWPTTDDWTGPRLPDGRPDRGRNWNYDETPEERKERKMRRFQKPGWVEASGDIRRTLRRIYGIRKRAKLPRCIGKSKSKMRKFEGLGDYSHTPMDHICDECRCGCEAGMGTNHLGFGLCYYHERELKGEQGKMKADLIMQEHKEAVLSGVLDGTEYSYIRQDPETYVEKIRKHAIESGNNRSVREEIVQIQAELQRLLLSYKEEGGFKKREKISEFDDDGRKVGERFEYIECDDLEKSSSLVKLANAVSKISLDNLRLTDSEVIERDQFIMFGKELCELGARMFREDKTRLTEFVTGFKSAYDRVQSGRRTDAQQKAKKRGG